MAKLDKKGKFVTSQKAYVSLKDEKNSMHLLRKGATLQWNEERNGFMIVKPSGDEEKSLVLDEKTFNSLKENKCIISSGANEAIAAAGTKNNVQLEQKVIELTTKNQDLEEIIDDLEDELEKANETIASLTGAALDDETSADDLDEDPADRDSDIDDGGEDEDDEGLDETDLSTFVLEDNPSK